MMNKYLKYDIENIQNLFYNIYNLLIFSIEIKCSYDMFLYTYILEY